MKSRKKEIERLVDDFMSNDKTRNQFIDTLTSYFDKEIQPIKEVYDIVKGSLYEKTELDDNSKRGNISTEILMWEAIKKVVK